MTPQELLAFGFCSSAREGFTRLGEELRPGVPAGGSAAAPWSFPNSSAGVPETWAGGSARLAKTAYQPSDISGLGIDKVNLLYLVNLPRPVRGRPHPARHRAGTMHSPRRRPHMPKGYLRKIRFPGSAKRRIMCVFPFASLAIGWLPA
jgi:hypothetical protein